MVESEMGKNAALKFFLTLLLLATPAVAVAAPVGSVDSVTQTGLVTGIARDDQGSGVIMQVLFYEGQALLGTVSNDAAGRFAFQLPAVVLDGKPHSVDIIMQEGGYGPTPVSGSPIAVNAAPPPPPPPPPPGTATFTLAWMPGIPDDAHDAATGFYVFRDEPQPAATIATVTANITTFVDAVSYPAGTTVCYSVAAFNDGGQSLRSNQVCAQVPTSTVRTPNPPGFTLAQ